MQGRPASKPDATLEPTGSAHQFIADFIRELPLFRKRDVVSGMAGVDVKRRQIAKVDVAIG
jgi:hypothetical protein